MDIANINPGAFANGFDYFCANCGMFFSVQRLDEHKILGGSEAASFCPRCGDDSLVTSTADLVDCCEMNCVDPVNYYGAFPLDEPIPRSRTGATPRQVKIIESLIILGRQAERPVTADSVAAESGYERETVEAVFEELHITESGAAA